VESPLLAKLQINYFKLKLKIHNNRILIFWKRGNSQNLSLEYVVNMIIIIMKPGLDILLLGT
jgi:hypothetical protein